MSKFPISLSLATHCSILNRLTISVQMVWIKENCLPSQGLHFQLSKKRTSIQKINSFFYPSDQGIFLVLSHLKVGQTLFKRGSCCALPPLTATLWLCNEFYPSSHSPGNPFSTELNRDIIFHSELNISACSIGQQLLYSSSIIGYHDVKSLFSWVFQEVRN